MADKNPEYYADRLGHFRKKVRDDLSEHGNALWVLHDSAKANLMRLKDAEVGLIILDECHHLLEHWGRVLVEIVEFLDNPIVLGLTATPPDIGEAGDSKPKETCISICLGKSTMRFRFPHWFGMAICTLPRPGVFRKTLGEGAEIYCQCNNGLQRIDQDSEEGPRRYRG